MWKMQGLTDTYLRVQAQAEQDLHNRISLVALTKENGQGLNGLIKT